MSSHCFIEITIIIFRYYLSSSPLEEQCLLIPPTGVHIYISIYYFGFLACHKLTCFSLAPKFKNGTKHSKLDPDEKTSPTSQKNFRSLRCSHCTWSRWWGSLTDRGQLQWKQAGRKGKTEVDLLRALYQRLSNYFVWIPQLISTDQRCVQVCQLVCCLTCSTIRISNTNRTKYINIYIYISHVGKGREK